MENTTLATIQPPSANPNPNHLLRSSAWHVFPFHRFPLPTGGRVGDRVRMRVKGYG